MKNDLLATAKRLPDATLLERMKALSQESRNVTVELVAHLVEVARRGLHRGDGNGRLFGYVTGVLRFSDAAAWNRIQAARAVRRFPVILDMLADGSVNLTTIRLLVPHLTKDNHVGLLDEAKGKGTREIKKIAARLAPRPDVASSVRKLPTPAAVSVPAPAAPIPAPSEPPSRTAPESHRPIVEPLAPARYRMQITLDEEMHADLTCVQDLARREIPDGDPAAIVRRALKLLRADLERKAFAGTSRPRRSKGTRPGSRDIDAAVQRIVWRRDGGQCAFVSRDGRRCTERSYLEFHHERPYALGGEKTVTNISLRCRSHNVYEAECLFRPHGASAVGERRPVHSVCFETRPSSIRTSARRGSCADTP